MNWLLVFIIGNSLILAAPPPVESLRGAKFLTCPSSGCDGACTVNNKGAICLTTETDPLPSEITDPDNLPASQKYRLVGCCEDYKKFVQWRLITAPVGACIIIMSHQLFSDQWMSTIDLGHVDLLNDYCCDTGTPVTTESSGDCPFCSWTCGGIGDNVVPDKDGCNSFCGE